MTNKQDSRYWAQANPLYTVSLNNQNRSSLNVWAGIVGDRVVGPYIYEQNMDAAFLIHIIRNELRYLLINNPILLRNMWWQMDGAGPHNTLLVAEALAEVFADRIISNRNRNEQHWPPRSPDLTPIDFFVWGRVKELVYGNGTPRTLEELRHRIGEAFQQITHGELQAVRRNIELRYNTLIDHNGFHIEPRLNLNR